MTLGSVTKVDAACPDVGWGHLDRARPRAQSVRDPNRWGREQEPGLNAAMAYRANRPGAPDG